MRFRVGTGYDVHRLVAGRSLILGGVTIPFELGLHGHSDADCLLHAIIDALLGGAGLGDIGMHFPDSDPALEGISSLILLEKVRGLLDARGYGVANVDATIVAQRPRISPFIPAMKANICRVLGVSDGQVNIKATTTEGLGFEGAMEGISCQAVALIYVV